MKILHIFDLARGRSWGYYASTPTPHCCFQIKYPSRLRLSPSKLYLWLCIFQLLQLLVVFDIAPIKLAENHRLSLAPTLRWGGRPLSLMAIPQQTTSWSRKYKSLAANCICVMHCVNGGTLCQDSSFGFYLNFTFHLVLVSIPGLNIHTHKLWRRTEQGWDFNEETWAHAE